MKPIFTVCAAAGAAPSAAAISTGAATPISHFVMVCPPFLAVPGSIPSAELHQHVVALELDRKHRDVLRDRRAQRLAGLDLEPAGVERTLDDAVLEIAVRQARIGVRADVVGGVDLAVDQVDRDLLVADG